MTELAPEKNLPEAPSSLAGGYRAMDEYVKWSVGPFWQQILGSTKQASFIKRAGEPRSEQVLPSDVSTCPPNMSTGTRVSWKNRFSSRDASEKVVNKPLLNRSERFLLAI